VTQFAQLLALALLLGLDSLRASATLASAGVTRPVRLALAFGLCDAAAPLAGLAAGRSLLDPLTRLLDGFGLIILVGCAVYALLAIRRADPGSPREPWAIVGGVPLSLSLDNLVVGAGLGVYGFPIVVSALLLGATSALLSVTGFAVGQAVARRLPPTELPGAALVLLLVVSLGVQPL
jgi:putative Mn2+ efflux pump MntP